MSTAGPVRRRWLLLAVGALLWHALHPLSAPLLARAHAAQHGDRAAFVEICSALGVKRLPLARVVAADPEATASTPAGPAFSGADSDHCPWCRLAGSDLICTSNAAAVRPVPAGTVLSSAPPAPVFPEPAHRPDHARGPPALL